MSQAGDISSTSGPVPPTLLAQFTFDDGTHTIVAGNNVNVNSGTGITVTANPDLSSSFIINAKTDSFSWFEENANFNAAVQSGYFCNTALTATLPTAGLVVGSTIIIYVDTALQVVIQAGAGQQIEISSTISSVAGSATAIAGNQGNMVTLVFKPSDSTWHAISSQGSWTLA